MVRILFVIFFTFVCNPLYAAVIIVDSLADEVTTNGLCSLREAVIAANSNSGEDCTAGEPGEDEVHFVENLTGTIGFVDSQALTITESLSIVGPGAEEITIDAGARSRVFHASQPISGELSISGLKIRGGSTTGSGGGLLVSGGTTMLLLDGVTFEGNDAAELGGAVAIQGISDLDLRVTNSIFLDNSATVSGGALYQATTAGGTSVSAFTHQNTFKRNLQPRSEASLVLTCDLAPCILDVDTNEFNNHSGYAAALLIQADEGSQNQIFFRNNVVRKDVSDAIGRSNDPGGSVIEAKVGDVYIYNNLFQNYGAELGGALVLQGGDEQQRMIVAFNSLWTGACIPTGPDPCARSVYVSNATAVLFANYFHQDSVNPATCLGSADGTGTIESGGFNVGLYADNSCLDTESAGSTDRLSSGTTRPGTGGGMNFFGTFSGPTARTTEIADILAGPCAMPAVNPDDPDVMVEVDYTGQLRPVDHEGDGDADCDAGATELSPLLTVFRAGAGEGDLLWNGDFGFGNIFLWDTELNTPGNGIYSEVYGGALRISAKPESGNTFVGFSEGCDGMRFNNGYVICEIISDEAKTITGTFEPEGAVFLLDVGVTGDGAGVISSNPEGIDCGPSCSAYFDADAVVTLSFETIAGSSFVRWEGDCSGSGVCQVTMDENRSVTGVFIDPDLILETGFELNP